MPIGNYGINNRIMNQELRIKNTVQTRSRKETEKLGQKIAQLLKGGEVLALVGELGSGKTTFVKGLAKGLGIKQPVTSPTFVLIKVYPITKHKTIKQLVHVDCYRLPGIEFNKIGLADYLNQTDTVVAIEWAEKIKPQSNWQKIKFTHGHKENERVIYW